MPPIDLKTRIKSIQARLSLTQTGIFDLNTAVALQKLAGKTPLSGAQLVAHLRAVQHILRCDVDGIVGPETVSRAEQLISEKLPILPAGSSMRVSKKSIAMLVAFEISSEATYNKKYQKPIWPGGESGITIGIGYDLGYNSAQQIRMAWGNVVSAGTLGLLASAAGKKGITAKNYLTTTQSAVIDYTAALSVFYQSTLPSFARRTKRVFPGVEKLAPDAQGALLSLVYNRGESTKGASRIEMLRIVDLVATQNLTGIAQQIRKMKRLWEGKNLPGLIERREKEATMVELASFNLLPEDIIVV